MVYLVRPGDSLSKIARRYGITLNKLLSANPRFAANPDKIRIGDAVDIPDGQPTKPKAASKGRSAVGKHKLGKLSERFETGGRGPGTVSSGAGDAGGASYGSYQMTSKGGGTVARFVSQPGFRWRSEFLGLKPGSPPFTAKWKEIAKAKPDAFHDAQHAYIKMTHYDPLVANVRAGIGIDVTQRSHALQDVIWSTAVQHGSGTNVVTKAFSRLNGLEPSNSKDRAFDRALIRAIYAERGRKTADGQLARFSRNSLAVQKGVSKRFVSEERLALRMLDDKG